jgi:hypothetical protein
MFNFLFTRVYPFNKCVVDMEYKEEIYTCVIKENIKEDILKANKKDDGWSISVVEEDQNKLLLTILEKDVVKFSLLFTRVNNKLCRVRNLPVICCGFITVSCVILFPFIIGL